MAEHNYDELNEYLEQFADEHGEFDGDEEQYEEMTARALSDVDEDGFYPDLTGWLSSLRPVDRLMADRYLGRIVIHTFATLTQMRTSDWDTDFGDLVALVSSSVDNSVMNVEPVDTDVTLAEVYRSIMAHTDREAPPDKALFAPETPDASSEKVEFRFQPGEFEIDLAGLTSAIQAYLNQAQEPTNPDFLA